MPEPPNAKFPLLLLTGRGAASQWHTQTRTSKSAVLRELYPQEVYVEINPADARRETWMQPFQRDELRGDDILRTIHHAHATAADHLDDAVALAQHFAWLW